MIEPMKAVLSDQPFSDPGWIFERKLDGIRCIAIRDGSGVSLMSRTAHRMNDQFPEIAEALEREPTEDFVLDGEVVALRGGVSSFELLQQRHRRRVPVYYYVFDIPRLDGEDLRPLPLRERKARLRRALEFQGPIRFNPHRKGEHGEELFREACRKGLEGVIAKRADSPYTREALARLAEAEVPRRAGARDRRLHGAEGVAHRLRRAARGLQRGRRAALRRQGGHRLRPRDCCASSARSCASSRRTGRRSRPSSRSRRARTGCGRSWSARSASRSGPATGGCATRASSGCATTSRPRDVVREVPS